MSDSQGVLVFDTGPLRHFALQGWLGVLPFVAGDRAVLIPESVEREIREQAHHSPLLHGVLRSELITVDRSDDLEYVAAFAHYERHLVTGTKNRGECGVLALGKTRGHELVLDDAVARRLAEDSGIRITSTLNLLCTAIRGGQLTVSLVEHVADRLIQGEYYLPFGKGGFRQWALEQALIDYE